MTCIAYSSGIMACDSLWTDGNLKSTFRTKIEKLDNGILFGSSGDNDDRALKNLIKRISTRHKLTMDELPSIENLAEINQDLTAMIVTPQRDIFLINTSRDPHNIEGEGVGVYPIDRPFYAIGAGGEMAIGAMVAGKTAVEAVEIVCDWNSTCHLPVHMISLDHG